MARETSMQCYESIKNGGYLSKAQAEVWETLIAAGPATAGEIHAILHHNSRNNIGSRISEMRSIGVVGEKGTRPCKVSGHICILWEVRDQMPGIMARHNQKKDLLNRIRELEGRVQHLTTLLATAEAAAGKNTDGLFKA
jgi:nicotinamide mononucleotide (NMN) deamidase PncC